MCERDSNDDILRGSELTRRRFSALGVAGFAAMLPRAASAVAVTESDVEIKTPDGVCDAHWIHPTSGAHPAVLVWPDIFGVRPAFRAMARRLAEEGYSVLTINPFYRTLKGLPSSREEAFGQMGKLTPDMHFTDAQAFVAWLDQQKTVDTKRKMGTTGYCLGGQYVMRTAATRPDRVGAGASFHGGGLTTGAPTSPHLQIPKFNKQAGFLIAIADNDDQKEPDSKNILRKAFDDARVSAEIEVYKGANHGWCPPDSQAYNQAQAERAWSRLLALFKAKLA